MNKMDKYVKLYIESEDIAFITINNKPVNALSGQLIDILTQKLIELKSSSKQVKALIIKSDNKHFCAGADLKERSKMDDSETLNILDKINDCFDMIESLDCVTIAAINGAAFGGGAELGLCCDFRIGTPDTIVSFPETSLGIIPGAGGTYRLPRLIGLGKAKYWILSAQKFSGEEAFSDGYLDFLAADDELFEAAIDLAEEICAKSFTSIIQAKKAMNSSDKSNRANELDFYRETLKSNDRINALKIFNKK